MTDRPGHREVIEEKLKPPANLVFPQLKESHSRSFGRVSKIIDSMDTSDKMDPGSLSMDYWPYVNSRKGEFKLSFAGIKVSQSRASTIIVFLKQKNATIIAVVRTRWAVNS